MTPENTPAVEPEPEKMGEFSRLAGVFFEPKKAFADIVERPRWLVPMLLVVLATVAFYIAYGQHIGWPRYIQDQMDNSARMQQQLANMPAEQRQNMLNMYGKMYPIMFGVGPVFGIPLMYLIAAGILTGIASGIMSAGVKFKQVFSIVCYAGIVGIVAKALAIVVIFIKNPDDFNLMNPLAFNPGAFMDPKATSKFIYTLASGLDLFVIWAMWLEAVGIKAAAGKRLTMGGAVFAVALPYLLLMLFGATMAGMFS